MIMSVFEIIHQYRAALLSGLLVTAKICAITWVVGIFVGAALGALGAKWRVWVGMPSRVLSFVMSGVPVLVFLFWLHYPLQAMLHVVWDPFYTSAATLTVINALRYLAKPGTLSGEIDVTSFRVGDLEDYCRFSFRAGATRMARPQLWSDTPDASMSPADPVSQAA